MYYDCCSEWIVLQTGIGNADIFNDIPVCSCEVLIDIVPLEIVLLFRGLDMSVIYL
jgi:hypothetical protein